METNAGAAALKIKGRGRPRKFEQLPGEDYEAYRKRVKRETKARRLETEKSRELAYWDDKTMEVLERVTGMVAYATVAHLHETDITLGQIRQWQREAAHQLAWGRREVRRLMERSSAYDPSRPRIIRKLLPKAGEALFRAFRIYMDFAEMDERDPWHYVSREYSVMATVRTLALLQTVVRRCRTWKDWPAPKDEPDWCKQVMGSLLVEEWPERPEGPYPPERDAEFHARRAERDRQAAEEGGYKYVDQDTPPPRYAVKRAPI